MLQNLATARTFFANFKLPCIYIALAAFLIGSGVGGYAMNHWNAGEVARAEKDTVLAQKALSDFSGEIARQSAEVKSEVLSRSNESYRILRDMDASITARIDSIPARIEQQLTAHTTSLRSLINAPQYKCLTGSPLPEPYLDLLRRPAGSAFAPGNPRSP